VSRVKPRHTAGWLFADLFLVLFLVALAVAPPRSTAKPVAKASGTPSSTHSGTARPTPTGPPKASTEPIGLDARSVLTTVTVGRAAVTSGSLPGPVADRVVHQVAAVIARDPGHRVIGFVITSGLAPTGEQGPAQQLAAAVNAALTQRLTADFCQRSTHQVVFRDEWRYSADDSSVRVELFFVNGCRRT
jgi:hypothetical protein